MKIAVTAVLLCCLSVAAHAEMQYGFARFTCAPQIDYFSVEAVRIYDIPFKDTKALPQFNARGVAKGTPGLLSYSSAPIHYVCPLEDRRIQVTITLSPSAGGECGAETRGIITVKQDGTPIVSHEMFGSGCFDSVFRVTAQPRYEQTLPVTFPIEVCMRTPGRDAPLTNGATGLSSSASLQCTLHWMKGPPPKPPVFPLSIQKDFKALQQRNARHNGAE